MSKSDIYTVGGAVQAGGGLYITRDADRELLELCRLGTYAYVLTPRQMGKSSLMFRTAEQLAKENIRTVKIDLNLIGVMVTGEQWYLGLLTEIEDQLALGTNVIQWWQAHSNLSRVQRLKLFFSSVLLAEIKEPVLIFVDEIDTTLNLDFTDDFYAALRHLYHARAEEHEFQRLTFVLIGVATPSDLIRDRSRTPYNVGHRVELTDFTFEEGLPLSEGLGLEFEERRRVFGWIMDWTGGHPYLTQSLCRAIAKQKRESWSKADVDRTVSTTFLGDRSEQDNNLQFVRDMLTKRAAELSQVLTTYRAILRDRPVRDEEQSLVKSYLKLSGVVSREGVLLRVRNRIYREVFNQRWVKEHLPVNWTKRLTRVAAGLILTLLLLSAPLAIYAWTKKVEAESALAQARVAMNNERLAKLSAETALQREREAREELQNVLEREKKASQEIEVRRADAEHQRQIAEEAAGREQEARHQAEEQQQEAQKQKQIAERQREEAQKQRRIADAQRQLTVARQLEMQGERALSEEDASSALVLFAKALTLNDRRETRERIIEATTKQPSRLLWSISKTGYGYNPIAFSPDGRNFAFGDEDGVIHLLGAEDGREMRTFSGHEDLVLSIAFSPDNKIFASGSRDGTVRLWNIETGSEIKSLSLTQNSGAATDSDNSIASVAFSPDGRLLAGASFNVNSYEESVLVWEVATGKLIHNLNSQIGLIKKLAFSPDGRLAAADITNKKVWIWDATLNPATVISLPHDDAVTEVAFSSAWQLASAEGKNIRIWDLRTNESRKLSGHSRIINAIAFSPDGRFIASGSEDQSIRLWDVETGRELLKVGSNIGLITDISFSPNGHLAASALHQPVKCWEVAHSEGYARLLSGRGNAIVKVAFSPNGKLLATSSLGERTANVWDVQTGKLVRIFSSNDQVFTNVSFSPNGRWLFLGGNDPVIRLRDPETGVEALTLKGHQDVVNDIAFSPDMSRLASGGDDDTVRIWNLNTNQEVFTLRGDEEVVAVSFSPDGRIVAAGGLGSTIIFWDVERGQKIRTLNTDLGPILNLAFSPNGRFLAATGGDYKVHLWEVKTGREIFAFYGQQEQCLNVAFSPDGQYLVWATGAGRRVRIFDLTNNREMPSLRATEPITSIAFSPDGRSIASGDTVSNIYLWDFEAIKGLYNASPGSVFQGIMNRTGLQVSGPELSESSQEQLAEILGGDLNTLFWVTPRQLVDTQPSSGATIKNLPPSDSEEVTWECPEPPSVATLNPFVISFTDQVMPCTNFPALSLDIANSSARPRSEEEWERGVIAKAGDEIYVTVYIDNGAANNLPLAQTVAKNVKITTIVDGNIGPEHTVTVSFGGDNTNVVRKSLPVHTGPNDSLQVVPNSGEVFDYRSRLIQSRLMLGNNTVSIGNLPPGFETDLFLRFRVKVVPNSIRSSGR